MDSVLLVLKNVWELLKDNWEWVLAVASFFAGIYAALRARFLWERRQFIHRVNFSLNYIRDNTLKFRTLREADISDVLLNNRHGRNVVVNCAREAGPEEPVLRLPKKDRWTVLNAILNEISEQFAAGVLAASMGMPTRTASYVFAITCEKHPKVRMNKIRIQIIEESLLQKIDQFPELQFEGKTHDVRLETLKRIKQLYNSEAGRDNLMRVELTTPGHSV